MACFVYEAMILFGIALLPGVLGAFFTAQTGHRHPWQSDTALRLYAFVIYAIYFVWFWSSRGQTLPMQTWHIRLETHHGARLSQLRALARYCACWVWLAPPALLASALGWTPWQSLAAIVLWIGLYALLALLHPQRQFWHDALCGTRLISDRPVAPPAASA